MMLRTIRYYGSIAALYILTIGTIGTLLYASQLFSVQVHAEREQPAIHQIQKQSHKVIIGKPIRITIPTSGIDLPIDEGHYDSAKKSWTLSPTHAQFATMSAPANNTAGTTFIYGHGTDSVFGKIGINRPPVGTEANIYTDNGLMFSYELQTTRDLKPTDTSILSSMSSGPPQLIIQTCTGALSEWRTLFTFTLRKAD